MATVAHDAMREIMIIIMMMMLCFYCSYTMNIIIKNKKKKQNSFGLHIKIPKGYRTFDIIKHLYSAFCLVCFELVSPVRIIRERDREGERPKPPHIIEKETKVKNITKP